MSYSERAYFDGDACAHCAARDEAARLDRIRKQGREAAERRYKADRRTNARAAGTGTRRPRWQPCARVPCCGLSDMTGQQQADEGLRLDRERRAAMARGDREAERMAERELERLLG